MRHGCVQPDYWHGVPPEISQLQRGWFIGKWITSRRDIGIPSSLRDADFTDVTSHVVAG